MATKKSLNCLRVRVQKCGLRGFSARRPASRRALLAVAKRHPVSESDIMTFWSYCGRLHEAAEVVSIGVILINAYEFVELQLQRDTPPFWRRHGGLNSSE